MIQGLIPPVRLSYGPATLIFLGCRLYYLLVFDGHPRSSTSILYRCHHYSCWCPTRLELSTFVVRMSDDERQYSIRPPTTVHKSLAAEFPRAMLARCFDSQQPTLGVECNILLLAIYLISNPSISRLPLGRSWLLVSCKPSHYYWVCAAVVEEPRDCYRHGLLEFHWKIIH